MRGSKKTPQRDIMPDVKYDSVLLAKFINQVMHGGKKSLAQAIVYGALDIASETSKKKPLEVFEEAVKTVQPQVEVRSRRVGGANYQVPLPVSAKRSTALAFRWIIAAARARKAKTMNEKLAMVIAESSQNLGDAIKKRDEMHRMAEANKAFAHFARFAK